MNHIRWCRTSCWPCWSTGQINAAELLWINQHGSWSHPSIFFFFFFAVSNRTMWAKIKLLSSYHICMLQNYFPQQLSVECGVSEMWLTLTQYGIVKRELGRVSRVLGECIETTGEGVPQQAASWHMGVHAVLDDLGRREEMREESERAGGRGCRRI